MFPEFCECFQQIIEFEEEAVGTPDLWPVGHKNGGPSTCKGRGGPHLMRAALTPEVSVGTK